MTKQNIHILYVDDHPLDRTGVDHFLKESGQLQISHADSKTSFDQQLATGDYDLVLSDVNILGLGGFDVIGAVRQKDENVPVIIVSGISEEQRAIEAVKRGAAGYVINTPDQIQRLPAIIEYALAQKHQRVILQQAEWALQDSERKYYNLFNYANDSIFILHTQNLHILDANENAAKRLGYSRDELLQKTLFEISIPPFAAQITDVYASLTESGSATYESTHQHKDGSEIRVEITSQIIDYAGHQVFQSFARDITTRKAAENELRRMHNQVQQYATELERRVVERTQELEFRVSEVNQMNLAMTNILADLQTNQHNLVSTQKKLELANSLLAQERIQEQTALLNLSQALLSENDSQAIINLAVGETTKALDCEFVSLTLTDDDMTHYSARAWQGWTDAMSNIVKDIPIDKNTAMGQAITKQIPVVVPDTDHDDFLEPEFIDQMGIKSRLIVPLVVGKLTIGGLAVNETQPRQWNEDEIRLLSLIANTAAQALERARLFKQVQGGRERLQSLSRQLAQAQEIERRNLARELHDQLGQALTAIKINLNAIKIQAGEASTTTLIEKVIVATDHAIEQTRNLSLDLRPSVLDDLGLWAALRWYFHRHASQTEITLYFEAAETELRFPAHIETTCFRVAQEAFTNILRHAQAHQVSVRITPEKNALELEIRDDGIGFDVAAAFAQADAGISLGLINMQERADLENGSLTIKSAPGEGTSLVLRLPINTEQNNVDQTKDKKS